MLKRNKKAMGGAMIVIITVIIVIVVLFVFGFLDKTKIDSLKKDEYCLKWDNETEKCLKFGVDVYDKEVNGYG